MYIIAHNGFKAFEYEKADLKIYKEKGQYKIVYCNSNHRNVLFKGTKEECEYHLNKIKDDYMSDCPYYNFF